MCSLFVRGFGIKRFLQVLFFSFCGFTVCVRFFRFSTFVRVWVSGPVFFSFCGFTVCIREFLQVLYVCQSLGVRALLRILLLGVSEFQGLICHRISLGLVFQFEVWVS